MLAFLGQAENIAFVVALALMLVIGLLQLVGMGVDLGADMDFDLDADADFDLLGWLGFGRVPLLVLIVTFLGIFGSVGLVGQQASVDALGHLWSLWIAVPAALAAALPLTGLAAQGLARVLPGDLTTAVVLDELVGRQAEITLGTARAGSPARARVEDRHGQAHYVMVEPDNDTQIFETGERVLLVRQEGHLFRAISRGDHRLPRLGG